MRSVRVAQRATLPKAASGSPQRAGLNANPGALRARRASPDPDGPHCVRTRPYRPSACRILDSGEGSFFLAQPEDHAAAPLRVDGVIPGELALISPRPNQRGWGDLLELLEPSPERRDPPCPQAGRCGGCHWLHIDGPAQTTLRIARLESHLRQARQPLPPDGIQHNPSPRALGYRVRARFQVEQTPGGLRLGYHGLGSREVVNCKTCPLLAPPLSRACQRLRHALTEREIPGLSGLEVTVLPGAERFLAVLNPRDRAPGGWPSCGEKLLDACGGALISVAAQPARGEGKTPIVGATCALGHTPAGYPIAVAARGFLQANLEAADSLADCVTRLSGAAPGVRILELFAGSGLLGWRMAAAGATVDAIESDALAVAAGQQLRQPPRGKLTLTRGDARRALPPDGRRADVVVADPPRAGLGPLAEELAARGPRRVVIVSCSMESLARDLQVFSAAGYRLRELATFDLFPQTRHLEAVALLDWRMS